MFSLDGFWEVILKNKMAVSDFWQKGRVRVLDKMFIGTVSILQKSCSVKFYDIILFLSTILFTTYHGPRVYFQPETETRPSYVTFLRPFGVANNDDSRKLSPK